MQHSQKRMTEIDLSTHNVYKKTLSLIKKNKNQNTKECNLSGRCSITDLNQ